MIHNKSVYLIGVIVMFGFMLAIVITGQMYYLIGSSLCMSLFGIGRNYGDDEKTDDKKRANKNYWELFTGIYLSVLAVFLLLNIDLVRGNEYVVGAFMLLPFVPIIISQEKRKIKSMK